MPPNVAQVRKRRILDKEIVLQRVRAHRRIGHRDVLPCFFAFEAKIRLVRDASRSRLPSHMLARAFVLCETQAVGTSLGR